MAVAEQMTLSHSGATESAPRKSTFVSRRVTYYVVGIGLTLCYFLLRGMTWQGSPYLHTLMESLATVLAVMVGVMALARFYSRRNNTYLLTGAGFLGTAFLDGYHTVVTSEIFAPYLPSALPSLIQWSWVASRMFLSVMLTVACLAWVSRERLGTKGNISEVAVYISVAVFTIASFFFFAFVPLPRAYYPEFLFHRPEELIPAAFFLSALFGFLHKGKWQTDPFEHWLVISLVVAVVSQVVFMSFSGQMFDLEFDLAHLLKKVSYICVLIGLVLSMYSIFQHSEESKASLAEANLHLQADIDKRQRVENQLRESESRLQAILDYSPTKIHITDAHGRYVLINRVSELLFGMTDNEARGKTSQEIFSRSIAKPFSRHDQLVMETGQSVKHEEVWTVEDGVHTFLTVEFPIFDSGGNIVGIGGIGTDITERKKTEQELAEKSALLETTLENMAQGIVVFDADHKLLASNKQFNEMFGFPPGFIRPGMTHEEITRFRVKVGHFGPGDEEGLVRRRIEHAKDASERTAERTLPNGAAHVYHRKPMPDGGAVVTYTDITARKRVREELVQKSALLETTLESMSHGITVHDADGRLIAFNQKSVKLRDYPPGFIRLGMTNEDAHRYKAERGYYGSGDVESIIAEKIKKSNRAKRFRRERVRADGTVVSNHRDLMPDGGYVKNYSDFTERKRMEEAMCAAKDQAEFANRSKSEFLSNMSHELRTPLNAVIGFSEMMMQENHGPIGNDKYVEYVEDINTSGQHLLGLINDILDLSKVEAGKVELNEEELDPSVVIQSCLSMVKGQARSHGLQLVTEFPDQMSLLRTDQRVLKQILLNLLSNAVKFTPEGGKITLKAWSRPGSGHVFQVIDTGIGVAIDDIPKILRPFTQIENALTRKYQGTGLGLPLVKNLVEIQGGSLDFQSEVGVGSTVTVRFPKERMA